MSGMDSKRFQELVEESTFNHRSFADLFTCGVCDMRMWADNIHEHLQSHVSVCTNYQFNNETKTIMPVFDTHTAAPSEIVGQKRKLPMSTTVVKQKVLVKSPKKQILCASPPDTESNRDEREQKTDLEVENYLNSNIGHTDRLSVFLDQIQHADNENQPTYFAAKPYPTGIEAPMNKLLINETQVPSAKKKSKAVKTPKSGSKAKSKKSDSGKSVAKAAIEPLDIGDTLTHIDLPYVVEGKELGTYHCAVVIESFTPTGCQKALPPRDSHGKFKKETDMINEQNVDSSDDDDDEYVDDEANDSDEAEFRATPLRRGELQNAVDSITNMLTSPHKAVFAPVDGPAAIKKTKQKKNKGKTKRGQKDKKRKPKELTYNISLRALRRSCYTCAWIDDHISALITSELKKAMRHICARVPSVSLYFQSVVEIEEFDVFKWAFRDLETDIVRQEVGTDVPDPKELYRARGLGKEIKQEIKDANDKKKLHGKQNYVKKDFMAPKVKVESNNQTHKFEGETSYQIHGAEVETTSQTPDAKVKATYPSETPETKVEPSNQTAKSKVETTKQNTDQNQQIPINQSTMHGAVNYSTPSLGTVALGNLNTPTNFFNLPVNLPTLNLYQNQGLYQNYASPFVYVVNPANTNGNVANQEAEKDTVNASKNASSQENPEFSGKIASSQENSENSGKNSSSQENSDVSVSVSGEGADITEQNKESTSDIEMLRPPVDQSTCQSESNLSKSDSTKEQTKELKAVASASDDDIVDMGKLTNSTLSTASLLDHSEYAAKEKAEMIDLANIPYAEVTDNAHDKVSQNGKVEKDEEKSDAKSDLKSDEKVSQILDIKAKKKYKITIKKIIKGDVPELIEKEDGTVEIKERVETSTRLVSSELLSKYNVHPNSKSKIIVYVKKKAPDTNKRRGQDDPSIETSRDSISLTEDNVHMKPPENEMPVKKVPDDTSTSISSAAASVATASAGIYSTAPNIVSQAAIPADSNGMFMPLNSPVLNMQQPVVQMPGQYMNPCQPTFMPNNQGLFIYNNILYQHNPFPVIPQQNLLSTNIPQFVLPQQLALTVSGNTGTGSTCSGGQAENKKQHDKGKHNDQETKKSEEIDTDKKQKSNKISEANKSDSPETAKAGSVQHAQKPVNSTQNVEGKNATPGKVNASKQTQNSVQKGTPETSPSSNAVDLKLHKNRSTCKFSEKCQENQSDLRGKKLSERAQDNENLETINTKKSASSEGKEEYCSSETIDGNDGQEEVDVNPHHGRGIEIIPYHQDNTETTGGHDEKQVIEIDNESDHEIVVDIDENDKTDTKNRSDGKEMIQVDNDSNENIGSDLEAETLYRCDICELDLDSKEELDTHNSKNHTHKEILKYYLEEFQRYVCVGCGTSKNKKRLFQQHILHCKSAAQCGFDKFDLKDYKNHAYINKVNRYKCQYCDCTFINKKSYIAHTPKCESWPLLQCDMCPYQCRTETALGKHKKKVHEVKTVKCTICQRSFPYLQALNAHIKMKHEGIIERKAIYNQAIICEKCGRMFRTKHNYASHVKKMHTLTTTCLYCDYVFGFGVQCQIHEGNHTGDFRFSCVTCRKVFPSCISYYTHMKNLHKIDNEHSIVINRIVRRLRGLIFTNICSLCKESFQEEELFLRHMAARHSMSPGEARQARLVALKQERVVMYRERVEIGILAEVGCQIRMVCKKVTLKEKKDVAMVVKKEVTLTDTTE